MQRRLKDFSMFLKRVLASLYPSSNFSQRLFKLAGSTGFGNLLLIASAPVLTRVFSPNDYGAFIIIVMIIGVSEFATGLRYEAAIPLCTDTNDALTLASLVIIISGMFALLVTIALLTFGSELIVFLNLSDQGALFWWLPVALILQGGYHSCNGWLLKKNDINTLSMARIIKYATMALLQIAGGIFSDGNPHALIFGFVAGEFLGILFVFSSLQQHEIRVIMLPSFGKIKKLAQQFRRFPIYSSPAAFLFNGSMMTPAILVGAVFGTAEAGLYGLAQRVMGIPIRFVALAANQVYTAELADIDQKHTGREKKLFFEIVKKLASIGILYSLIILIFGPILFDLFFGSEWKDSGTIARFLVPMYFAMFMNQSVQYTLQYFGRQDLLLITSGIAFLSMFVVFFISYVLSFSLEDCVFFLGLSLACVYLIAFSLAWAVVSGNLRGISQDVVRK